MKLIVLDKGVWKPSKYDYGKNRRVTFETLDHPVKYYYLNITEAHGIVEKWDPVIVEGNVLEVDVLPNTNQINKWGSVKVIREVSHGRHSTRS